VVLLLSLKGHTFPELTPIHSENTPLTHRRGKRKCNTVAAAVLILVSLFAIFGPYVLSGVPRERRKWEQELMRRRAAEQSRIDDWEARYIARQHEEMVRQDEWERSQKNIRREEAHRREQERRREEEWQLEEEKRQRLGLHWDTPTADSHCTAHNSREYWARLLNTVPFDYNWLKPCQDIPLVIHGRSLNTTRCYINKYVSSLVQPTGISDDGCH
jgi:ribosomal protein L14E/L6E/L27E